MRKTGVLDLRRAHSPVWSVVRGGRLTNTRQTGTAAPRALVVGSRADAQRPAARIPKNPGAGLDEASIRCRLRHLGLTLTAEERGDIELVLVDRQVGRLAVHHDPGALRSP